MGSDPIHKPTQPLESPRVWGLTPLPRLLIGGWLVWCLGTAAAAPELPAFCAPAALLIFVATLWQPRWGLVLATALATAGTLLAAAPVRAAELCAWALLAGWLLRVWRPLSASAWPRAAMVPAALYGAALAASWLSLTIAGAAGVPPLALPGFLFQSLPRDHLLLSSPAPETWTLLHSLTGLGVFIASIGIVRDDPRTVRTLAWALAGSMTVLAAATIVAVAREWAAAGYGVSFLLRYARGDRFSLHLGDLNAAGSLYVLAGVIAWALRRGEPRVPWLTLFVALLPAILLTGSRSAFIALIGGILFVAAMHRDRQPMRARTIAGAALVAVVVSAAVMAAPQGGAEGSAERALGLRAQFSRTSARMFASSPVFGVGIGRYFDRSAEFMTPELREIYGNENAHNYFAQQFAELGVIGGGLFVWLIAAVVRGAWRRVREATGDAALVGLFAGACAYLLTCVTSHPLLVPEAALPFWAVFGAIGGAGSHRAVASKLYPAIGVAACVVLLTGAGLGARAYGRYAAAPPDAGFHGLENAADGTPFRWMTRHAVTYIPDGTGFIRLRLRGPDRPVPRPIVVETSIAGRVVDRREVPAGDWVRYDIAVRDPGTQPFRRVDFRVNQVWTEEVPLGNRAARRPISVMAREIRWVPLP